MQVNAPRVCIVQASGKLGHIACALCTQTELVQIVQIEFINSSPGLHLAPYFGERFLSEGFYRWVALQCKPAFRCPRSTSIHSLLLLAYLESAAIKDKAQEETDSEAPGRTGGMRYHVRGSPWS